MWHLGFSGGRGSAGVIVGLERKVNVFTNNLMGEVTGVNVSLLTSGSRFVVEHGRLGL